MPGSRMHGKTYTRVPNPVKSHVADQRRILFAIGYGEDAAAAGPLKPLPKPSVSSPIRSDGNCQKNEESSEEVKRPDRRSHR